MSGFEEEFTDAQTAMIAAAVDYASGQADDIYIYFSTLLDMLTTRVFFSRRGCAYEVHKLPGIDTSIQAQRVMLDAFKPELDRIWQGAIDHEQPIPREGWIHYHVGGGVDARYSYQDIELDDDPAWDEKVDAWMESVQKELDAGLGESGQRP